MAGPVNGQAGEFQYLGGPSKAITIRRPKGLLPYPSSTAVRHGRDNDTTWMPGAFAMERLLQAFTLSLGPSDEITRKGYDRYCQEGNDQEAPEPGLMGA